MLVLPDKAPCRTCRHFLGVVKSDPADEETERLACTAFDDIPEAILIGENKHREPYPGDGGVQYEAEVA